MAMFGWQGATCIDEWTMAACNLAMGTTLLLGGSGAFSLDNVLLRRRPQLAGKAWFRWMGGALPLPQTDLHFRNLGLALFAFVAIYDVGTYDHYRGSVYGAFHGGPVSPTKHHVTLTDGVLLADGGVRVHAYLDAGTPEAQLHLVDAALIGSGKQCWRIGMRRRSPPCRRPTLRTITRTTNSRQARMVIGLRWVPLR